MLFTVNDELLAGRCFPAIESVVSVETAAVIIVLYSAVVVKLGKECAVTECVGGEVHLELVGRYAPLFGEVFL